MNFLNIGLNIGKGNYTRQAQASFDVLSLLDLGCGRGLKLAEVGFVATDRDHRATLLFLAARQVEIGPTASAADQHQPDDQRRPVGSWLGPFGLASALSALGFGLGLSFTASGGTSTAATSSPLASLFGGDLLFVPCLRRGSKSTISLPRICSIPRSSISC